MKVCTLIHNPGAGAEKYSKEELIAKIENLGYECRYSSIKKRGWKDIDPDTDFLVVAGGDGTVRKVTKRLLNRRMLRKRFPIGLLPLGTANNISKTLKIEGEPEEIGKTWTEKNLKKIDIGFIQGLAEPNFFLEGFGQGIFPILIQKMKESDGKVFSNLQEEIKYSLEVLQETLRTYKPEELQLQIDGQDHSGRYLLAEIMNIRSIGPNLMLAPDADPGDGELEVVLVAESHRAEFAKYVQNKLKGIEDPFVFNSIKAKSIRMHCENTHIHIDDELIMVDDQLEINIEVFEGQMKFFTALDKS